MGENSVQCQELRDVLNRPAYSIQRDSHGHLWALGTLSTAFALCHCLVCVHVFACVCVCIFVSPTQIKDIVYGLKLLRSSDVLETGLNRLEGVKAKAESVMGWVAGLQGSEDAVSEVMVMEEQVRVHAYAHTHTHTRARAPGAVLCPLCVCGVAGVVPCTSRSRVLLCVWQVDRRVAGRPVHVVHCVLCCLLCDAYPVCVVTHT